jgi:acyl-lipid omega-6 desaturase (Delta-12 desaturase)
MIEPKSHDGPGSLGAVIECIPEECYENPTWKGLAWFARDLALYALNVLALIYFDNPILLVGLWLLSGLTISALFILGHDAAHGSLFKDKRLAYLVGQTAMLPGLHVYEAWVFGHNRIHHGHTTRQEMDYVWHPATREQYAALTPLQKLAHRLKWSCIGGGVYYMWDIWWKSMMLFTPPEKIADAVRRDRRIVVTYAAVASAAFLALGAFWYGSLLGAAWMWAKVFAIPFVVWNYSIGVTVYIHHIAADITWYARREWTKFRGQMEGTTVIHLPWWLNTFYHNIYLHVAHHVDMRIPFYGLPAANEALRKHYGHVIRERAYSLRDYLATTRACKLFDFERGVWCDYSGRPTTELSEAA